MPGWPPPRSRHTTLRGWLPIAAGAAVCYIASYTAYSSWGQYVPSPETEGARARWAPGEFYDFTAGRWRRGYAFVFAPLLWLDQRFWHPDGARPAPEDARSD